MSQHYKDLQGKVHFLDDTSFEYLLPAGCVPITPAEATAILAPTLAQVQASKIGQLTTAYNTAIAANISYTSIAGVTSTYQATTQTIANLQSLLIAYQSAPTTLPATFYWVAADNTRVPFTYADMQLLAQAIAAQSIVAFAHLQTQKLLVTTADATVASVNAVTW